MKLSDELKVKLEGHLRIFEFLTEEDRLAGNVNRVLLDKRNAVHNENASIILARGLADRDNGAIYTMCFGTGGATINPLGDVVFATPNVTGGSANLYNQVFLQVVDDNQGAPTGNSMSVRHINGTLFSDVEIRGVMGLNEPFGQAAFDNVGIGSLNSSNFVFSEIGLKSADGLLITHVIFSPIQKSANRVIEVVYVIRITLFSTS